jgi:choline dehydrogenase-like flavoprotein
VEIYYKRNNELAHKKFRKEARRIFQKASPNTIVLTVASKGSNLSHAHACGTLVFGEDPKTSVLDPYCKTHDVENLYVVDSSFFPSSAAVNPALTIIAQALRVGEHLCKSAS